MQRSANIQVLPHLGFGGYRTRVTARPVIYARISDDAELAGLGVARQLIDCRELAERLGLADPIEIVDNDVSAFDTRRSRPGWKQLIELVRSGDATAILAWHTDRLYRRLTDLEALATLLESHPVAITPSSPATSIYQQQRDE
jgi:site-specific DNA recombinase